MKKKVETTMRQYSIHMFEIPRSDGQIPPQRDLKNFWKDSVGKVDGLPDACGCYIFAIRAGKGITPWYVGKTERSFKNECLNGTNIGNFNRVLKNKGAPLLFLIARRTPEKFGFAKPHSEILDLEKLIMHTAFFKNSGMLNIRELRLLRSTSVPSLVNTPRRKPTTDEKALRKALST